MSNKSLDNKCPACRAVIKWNPTLNKFKCEYCDSEFTLNEMKKYNTDKFVVNFMKPSWRFPVYWTEEWDIKNTWHRDGSYLANYFERNRVAYLRCDANGIRFEKYF